MNHFDTLSTAERYAKGRPAFHQLVIDRISRTLQLQDKVDRALDIACGTGLSSRPLLNIAKEVHGTDHSEHMLAYARQEPRIHFQQALADNQPFPDHHVDLITVCSAVHWFEIDAFLEECFRIMKSHACLVLYDNFFLAEMEGEASFQSWVRDKYLIQYPSPPRNNSYDWSPKNLAQHGFDLRETDRYQNPISMTRGQLILYFTTQSNIAAAIEREHTSYAEVEAWLDQELDSFFPTKNAIRTLRFGSWIRYLAKLENK